MGQNYCNLFKHALSSTPYKTLIQPVVIISSGYDQAFAAGNAQEQATSGTNGGWLAG
jgi:hypothetical protein